MNNEQELKSKSFSDILDEYPTLQKEMTYDELNDSIKQGIDDSGIDEAYEAYLKIKRNVAPKSFSDILVENPTLQKRMTYDEFKNGTSDLSENHKHHF